MTVEIEEQPTHVHICDSCGVQYTCGIKDCELLDNEDTFLCPSCEDAEDEIEEEDDYGDI